MPEVLTAKGFREYSGLLVSHNKPDKLVISCVSGERLKCTIDHKVLLENGEFIQAKDLVSGNILFNNKIVEKKEFYHDDGEVYDLINVKETHSYFTNGMISHNCVALDEMAFIPKNTYSDFYKSVYPTISSGKETRFISVSTPNGMNHFYDAWMNAVDGKSTFVPFEVNWWDVPGRDEKWKNDQLQNMTDEDFAQEFGNCVLGDSIVTVRDKETGDVINMTIAELYSHTNI